MLFERKGGPYGNYQPSAVGETSDRRRLPSSYVHCFRLACTLPESLGEKQLCQCQMGAVPHQGSRLVSDSSEQLVFVAWHVIPLTK